MDTATDFTAIPRTPAECVAAAKADAAFYAEIELERLQAALELAWARADDVQGSAEFVGHQLRCERICARIAELKGQA